MVFGDFNAKHTSWNCNINNKSGNLLLPDHTHFPHSGQTPSTIDLVLSNVNFAFDITTNTNQMSSDHTPIVCSTFSELELTHKVVFDYQKADWNKFRQTIDHSIAQIPVPISIEQIDNAIDEFTSMLVNARSNSFPTKSFHSKSKLIRNK